MAAVPNEERTPITIGENLQFTSEILGDSRPIQVATPPAYRQSEDARYPVLYVQDGPGHFVYLVGLVRALAEYQKIPPMIVVSVGNTDRDRDMTPPTSVAKELRDTPTAGGADNFIRFFAEELIPWVDAEYRTEDYRILVGHSFGGLFAVHTLVHRPELFSAYLAISPSLWWDEQRLVSQADGFFRERRQLRVDFYMTMGNEGSALPGGGAMLGGARKLAGVLDEHAPKDFRWTFNWMDEETHGSIPLRSTVYGLERIFDGWHLQDPLPTYELGGMHAVEGAYQRAEERFGLERALPEGTWQMLIFGLARRGRIQDAVDLLDYDLNRFTMPVYGLQSLADEAAKAGDREAAIELVQRALAVNPAMEAARNQLTELGVEPPPLDFTINESERAELLGSYRIGEGVGSYTFIVRADDDTLRYHPPDEGEPSDIGVTESGNYFLSNGDTQLHANREDGRIVSFTLISRWGKFEARKLDDSE